MSQVRRAPATVRYDRPPSCRGQAVPNWPARGAGRSTPRGAVVPRPSLPGRSAANARGWSPGLSPQAPWRGLEGAEAPGSIGWVPVQLESAGLGTEPGRSRPGDRGDGRSADRRCVSGETCRPRCITAPPARRARRCLAPTRWDDPSPSATEASPWCATPRLVGVRRCRTGQPAGRRPPGGV